MYTRVTRIPCPLGVRNYFAYKSLTWCRIRVELASPANLGLGILLPINVYFAYKRLTSARIRMKLASSAYLWIEISLPKNICPAPVCA